MILILSVDQDHSTDKVCDWLYQLKANYVRLHPGGLMDKLHSVDFSEGPEIKIRLDALNIEWSRVNVVWNRKWNHSRIIARGDDTINYITKHNINKTCGAEFTELSDYIFSTLTGAHWLDHPSASKVNKLILLELARKTGLSIPRTIITGEKVVLKKFKSIYCQIITKPISNGTYVVLDERKYLAYTAAVSQEDIERLPDHFSPSLFQVQIEKDFEIRVFYLNNVCYSMAIFSQKDSNTSVDCRRYNRNNPSRSVPFKLPESIERKIQKFMKSAQLNTGSLDFIKTKSGDFVFLEVNTVGQYGMTDIPCNYGLDKIIAEYLIKEDHERARA